MISRCLPLGNLHFPFLLTENDHMNPNENENDRQQQQQ